jgi:hypothetical protein
MCFCEGGIDSYGVGLRYSFSLHHDIHTDSVRTVCGRGGESSIIHFRFRFHIYNNLSIS